MILYLINSHYLTFLKTSKTATTPRLKHFIWMCLHGSIQSTVLLQGRDTNVEVGCSIYLEDEEDIDHILRNCNIARRFWDDLGIPRSKIQNPNKGVDWSKFSQERPGLPLFQISPWQLRKKRNNFIFKNSPTLRNSFLNSVCPWQEVQSCGSHTPRSNLLWEIHQMAPSPARMAQTEHWWLTSWRRSRGWRLHQKLRMEMD